jgi:hypothetical protein
VKLEIDRHVDNDKNAINASKITIDYNVEFTKDILDELGGPTSVRFEKRGGNSILVVASVEYAELGPEVFGTGADQFSRLYKRTQGGDEQSKATTCYCSPMSGSYANRMGLVGSGRYTLEYIGSDDYKNQEFKLIFDSITISREDKRRLLSPGLTVAVS